MTNTFIFTSAKVNLFSQTRRKLTFHHHYQYQYFNSINTHRHTHTTQQNRLDNFCTLSSRVILSVEIQVLNVVIYKSSDKFIYSCVHWSVRLFDCTFTLLENRHSNVHKHRLKVLIRMFKSISSWLTFCDSGDFDRIKNYTKRVEIFGDLLKNFTRTRNDHKFSCNQKFLHSYRIVLSRWKSSRYWIN